MDILTSLIATANTTLTRATGTYAALSSSSSSPISTDTLTYLLRYLNSYTPSSIAQINSVLMSADLVTLLALLVALFVGFKVLDYLRRLVLFWVTLAVKLVLVLCVVQLALYAYTVGLEQTLQDLGRMWGWVEGAVDGAGGGAGGTKRGKSEGAVRQRRSYG